MVISCVATRTRTSQYRPKTPIPHRPTRRNTPPDSFPVATTLTAGLLACDLSPRIAFPGCHVPVVPVARTLCPVMRRRIAYSCGGSYSLGANPALHSLLTPMGAVGACSTADMVLVKKSGRNRPFQDLDQRHIRLFNSIRENRIPVRGVRPKGLRTIYPICLRTAPTPED